jgi:hypothetical protein
MNTIELKPGLVRTGPIDVEATLRQTELEGYATFLLPGSGIVDRASFFDAAREVFPLEPPLLGSHSWDALSDSLWEGLYAHPARRIAILWPHTRAMEVSALSDFETALSLLADVASSLADPRATSDSSKEVTILVE